MSRVSRKSENQPIPNDDLMSRESSTREDQNVEEKISTSDQNLDGAVEVDNEIGADEPEVIIVEPEEEKEPEQPYEPPPFNFIKVEFGDSPPILVNHRCMKRTFVDFINNKMGKNVDIHQFDMCDTSGDLVGLRNLDHVASVQSSFIPSNIYIPCVLSLDEIDRVTAVEPCLNGWEYKYPALENLKSIVEVAESEGRVESTEYTMEEIGKKGKDTLKKDNKELRTEGKLGKGPSNESMQSRTSFNKGKETGMDKKSKK